MGAQFRSRMGWGRKNQKRKRPNPKKTHRKNFDTLTQKAFQVTEQQVVERWDKSLSTRQNYEKMGLVHDPNKSQKPAEQPIDIKVPEAPGKVEAYLTMAEIINCRTMILKHGTDYLAMWRDIKLNRYQHTRKKLKTMCEVYMKEYAADDPYYPKE